MPKNQLAHSLHLILALLVFSSGCANNRARENLARENLARENLAHENLAQEIPKLIAREAQIRLSVQTLDSQRQRLEQDIKIASVRASTAKCEASVAEYRAAVARQEALHLREITDYLACAARKAKAGGETAAVGCMLGIIVTGGWGAAICGSALLASGSVGPACGPQPSMPTHEQIEAEALVGLGLLHAPSCGNNSWSAR